ncbi:hypothetical protein BC827DRAFT_723071 [Russula dissimulans]|nr:hypothetical protein BC827DRAFT_723071 [Russula dissimulans]
MSNNGYNLNHSWNTHPSATNNIRTIADPPSNLPPQYGAAPVLNSPSVSLYPTRGMVTAASVPQGQSPSQPPPIPPTVPTASSSIGSASSYVHYRPHQSAVVSPPPNASRPAEERSVAGLGYHLSAQENLNWAAPADNGGLLTLSQGQSQGHNGNNLIGSSRPPRRPSRNNPPSPPAPIAPVDGQKNCIIPGCPYPAYYNFADQEQTEYCGQGHELEAISTGLVDTCVMCKGRPRRTGERVCGRTCRQRAHEARPVQGMYYGARVTRFEAQTGSGA